MEAERAPSRTAQPAPLTANPPALRAGAPGGRMDPDAVRQCWNRWYQGLDGTTVILGGVV